MNAPPRLPKTRLAASFTSREFNQYTARAKQAADNGPVVVTDRGRPAYVLLSYEDYGRLSGIGQARAPGLSALQALADPNYREGDVDLMDYVPPRRVEPARFTFDDDE